MFAIGKTILRRIWAAILFVRLGNTLRKLGENDLEVALRTIATRFLTRLENIE